MASVFVLLLFVLSPLAYSTASINSKSQHASPQVGATPLPKLANSNSPAPPDPPEPAYCTTIGGSWDGVSTCTFSGSYTLLSGSTLEITSGTTLVISNSGPSTTGVTVNSGETLTVDSGGAITTDNSGSASNGIVSEGTFTNSGTITTENPAAGSNGLWIVYGAFTSSGTITIENPGNEAYGVFVYIGATFTNSGTITIENSGTSDDGIVNSGTFNNYGTVTIENSAGFGIWNNGGAIFNECDATITVENTGGTGINNEGGSITNNGGSITGYAGAVTQGTGCTTSTTTSTTTTTSSEVQVGITLNQFVDYGSALSASNYFTVTYMELGSTQTAHEAGGLLTIMADPSTSVAISAVSSGSNIFEQWCLSITAGTCGLTTISVGSSAVSAVYVYFDLQAQVVDYDTAYDSPVAPFFNYATAPSSPSSSAVANDQSVSAVPISPGDAKIWVIAGTLETFDSVINTSPATTGEQWQGVPNCSYLANPLSCGSSVAGGQVGPFSQGGIAIEVQYYLQYSVAVTYALSTDPGTGYSLPTLSYESTYGVGSTLQITCQYGTVCTPQTVWILTGSLWSVNSPLGGSTSTEQWGCTSGCSGTIHSTGEEIAPTYTHEYLVTFTAAAYYGCTGSGYPPLSAINTCINYGPNISPYGPTWVPAGQPFTVSTDVTNGNTLLGWTTCASWSAINGLPSDSGCPASNVAIPSGLGTETSNGYQTQITASGPGTVYADGVFSSSGSTSTCTGGNCSYVTGTSAGYAGSSDPVYVLVTGPFGIGQVGCDAVGTPIDTMALASVSSCGGDTESIIIANPVVGQYEVQLFPDGGTGAFNLTATSEDSGGNPIGTPLLTSGTCTGTGGCGPFYVTEGGAGFLSFSYITPPGNQYVIVACITTQAECNRVGYSAPLDITYYAASTSAAVAYANTLVGTYQAGLSGGPVESFVIYLGAQEAYP